MAITLRRRGKAGLWYARGTVRVGRQTVQVAEFCTGCSARGDAETVVGQEEARIRAECLEGPAGRARSVSVADCFLAYLNRPGGVRQTDKDRIGKLNEAMGHRPLAEAADAWREWVADHARLAPGTLARWRTALAAALSYGAEHHKTAAPKLMAVKVPKAAWLRVPILTPAKRAALLRSYSPHSACPILVMAEQGLRTQECLQLRWEWIDFDPVAQIRVPAISSHTGAAYTKSGRGRVVPMTRRTEMLLWGMWHAAGRPEEGHVFLNRLGEPYRDTRDNQGGNPLKKAHDNACRRAKVSAFRVHDWRHDWAARCIMGGMDTFTLMKLGGWTSLKMVEERYGAVSAQHMRDAVRRVA